MLLRHHHHPWEDLLVSVTESGSPATRVEPVDLTIVKQHLRFQSSAEDDLLADYVSMARTYFEEQTGRQGINATWEYAHHGPPLWSRTVELPRAPLYGDVVITYDDPDGNPQTFDASNYLIVPSFLSAEAIDPYCRRGRVELVAGASWPVTLAAPRSFRVTRTCGYGETPAVMPPALRSLLYLLIAHYHRNRSEVFEAKTRGGAQMLPLGADVAIGPFKYSAQPTSHSHEWRGRHEYWDLGPALWP